MQQKVAKYLAGLALLLVSSSEMVFAEEIRPRTRLAKEPIVAPAPEVVIQAFEAERIRGRDRMGLEFAVPVPRLDRLDYQLSVKFQDDVQARVTEGNVISLTGVDMGVVNALQEEFGLQFSPLIDAPEDRLDSLEKEVTAYSRTRQPDLRGMIEVEVIGRSDPAILLQVGEALQALDVVEFVDVQALDVPPPGDLAPFTPDLFDLQVYRAPDPGLDVHFAAQMGLTGAGIRVYDVEYGWVGTHEDLEGIGIRSEPGQNMHHDSVIRGDDEHGTAALGIVAAENNDYGVIGIAPAVEILTFPERSLQEGFRRVTATTNAIADARPGDIIMLEMQEFGIGGSSKLVPAEFEQNLWTVVRLGVDKGVVVIAAAGNGSVDLDSAPYEPYRKRGGSGAIIVGAGTPDANHDRLPFSTYGTRVDVQAWGEGVFTLGYGEYAAFGRDKNQHYTHLFNGTSAALPQVVGVAALLQERAIQLTGKPFPPEKVRRILRRTGRAQGTATENRPIGPFIDLRAALLNAEVLNDDFEDRAALMGTAGEVSGNNTHATFEALESNPGMHSVWWEWNAPGSGTLYVELDAASGEVEVFSGPRIEVLTLVPRVAGGAAVESGGRYHVRVSSPEGEGNEFDLRWRFVPG